MSSKKGHSHSKKKNREHGRKHRRKKNLAQNWLPKPSTLPRKKRNLRAYKSNDLREQTPFRMPIYLLANLRTPKEIDDKSLIREYFESLYNDLILYKQKQIHTNPILV